MIELERQETAAGRTAAQIWLIFPPSRVIVLHSAALARVAALYCNILYIPREEFVIRQLSVNIYSGLDKHSNIANSFKLIRSSPGLKLTKYWQETKYIAAVQPTKPVTVCIGDTDNPQNHIYTMWPIQ